MIEGFQHEEIAEMLGIQPGTSCSQLVKARTMLQKQITELQKLVGMNYNQHFDDHIKEQLQDYSPCAPRIWENIMKEREKKRLPVLVANI